MKDIPRSVRSFENHIPKSINVNELQNAIFLLETNKCPGLDEINFNV